MGMRHGGGGTRPDVAVALTTMKAHILTRVIPPPLRDLLRQCAVAAIPSMRHLDMPKRLRHLKSLGMNPRVVYDVGAAQGKWAQLAASIWPDARIIGFEPNRANIGRLEQVQRELPNFEYIRCFLGTKQQVVDYEYRGNQTSLYNPVAQKEPTDTADMLVLDDLIAQQRIPRPDFIKMDVQGYELEVLRGGGEALKTCDMILLEVSFYREHLQMPIVQDVITFMAAHGFRWFDVMGLIRYPDDDALWQMDLHFLKTTHSMWGRHE